jgi:arginase
VDRSRIAPIRLLFDTRTILNGIDIIVAPFHAGIRSSRVGKGPHRLLDAGMAGALTQAGADLRILEIPSVDHAEGEIGQSFEVMRHVATNVAATVRAGRFPLVLAGNCNASVGTCAGLGDRDAGLVWFDAHPDFSTPDEATSGYFDGMGVAILAGQCWHRLAATVPGFRPLSLSRLIYCGIRDFDPGQREKVERHGIRTIYGSTEPVTDFAGALDAALADLPGRVAVHLDLDSLDTSVGLATSMPQLAD